MNTLKHNPIALKLPSTVALLIVFARHVVQAMDGNAWFPAPTPSLAVVAADIDALEAAEATVRSRAKGTAAARDLKRRVVEGHLMALGFYVQTTANQDPEHAVAIITSAGMSPRRYTPAKRAPLSAAKGAAVGTVVVRAKAVRGRVAYEWQISSDGGASWTSLGITTVASTTVPGLAVGTTYLFRVRTTVGRTTGEWSQSLAFTAH